MEIDLAVATGLSVAGYCIDNRQWRYTILSLCRGKLLSYVRTSSQNQIHILHLLMNIVPVKLIFLLARIACFAYRHNLSVPTYLTIALVRAFLTTFTPYQIQFLLPSTSKTCESWLKRQSHSSFPFRTALSLHSYPLLRSGGMIHWFTSNHDFSINETRKDKVLLFFHGGGYAVPLTPSHLDWCLAHLHSARRCSTNLHIVVLEYSLAPKLRYPTQLSQAAEALHTILQRGFLLRDIIIGGDSAGGNLTFALLGHLLHPHPDPKVVKIKIEEPLAGAFGISPWVSMDSSAPSFSHHQISDMLSQRLIRQSAQDYLGDTSAAAELKKGNWWSMPGDAEVDWWSGLGRVTRRVYLNVGTNEMFYDHVLGLAARLMEVCNANMGQWVDVKLDIGIGESHDQVLTDFIRGQREGRAVKSLMGWMEGALL
ncbi:alpha/beta-hydrolase [Periconia macrospinosa]|uniref:Alpha/beta-hydrolase n=1 Tax=Periconia macrospinosa TaxID=97972 RepID=A0A2V1D101_9PLEO|nr:alpha/beta-hydrolase [Periconia macrospinosa]